MNPEIDIDEFLRPLRIDVTTAHQLAHEFRQTFKQLAAESLHQFLPTPISESILRPTAGSEKGRYLAIDIGGTNLRVGFIELLGGEKDVWSSDALGDVSNHRRSDAQPSRLQRVLEKSWPILDQLKNEKADDLFIWIGSCIAEIVSAGCLEFNLPRHVPLPLGVTFSFPMLQDTLSKATLMAMGKGFAITSNLDLGSHLTRGYESARSSDLPPIKIAAIANDAVATLVSFIYQSHENSNRKAAMGLICGTGCNATIALKENSLHPDKLPKKVKILAGDDRKDVKVAVNTEWTINGTAPTLRKFGLINEWDEKLDAQGEAPGFQPLEYMTSGRYLGELGRLVLQDYLVNGLGYSENTLPPKLLRRFALTTTFLSQFKPANAPALLEKLAVEFPIITDSPFQWSEGIATTVYKIAKTIEIRAAGIIAAASIGLLAFAGDLPLGQTQPVENGQPQSNGQHAPIELVVGYTGGCITHFQDYLADCQQFLDRIVDMEFGASPPVRVVLSPCHDGGITGAGVLCGSSQSKLGVEA